MNPSAQWSFRYAIVLHTLSWIGFFCLPILLSPFPSSLLLEAPFSNFLSSQLFGNVFFILFFYLNLHKLTPLALKHRRVFPLVIAVIASLLFLILAHRFFFRPQMPPPEFRMKLTPRPMPMMLPIPQIMSFLLVLGISSVMALLQERTRTQEEQQQTALEKISAELAVLKLQISPHFLFNTLNNIRWLARKRSDQTEEAILKLSDLLRYILRQSQPEKVPLSDEISHLQNYIDLQKMRLTAQNKVLFSFEGEISGIFIEPLLFIPFVENAFKYGIHHQQPSEIMISIKVQKQSLNFVVSNPLFPPQTSDEKDSFGIGIPNVRRRLELHYPAKHHLQVTEESDFFRVELAIELA